MELKIYLRMLIRSWWIVALTTLAALNVALLNAYLATPQYNTQARFLIAPSKLLSTADFIRLLSDQTFMQTFAEIWNGDTNFDKTGAALQLASSDLNDYSRTAVIAPSASVVELTVTGPSGQHAALIANTLGGFAMAEINDTYGAVVSVSVLDAANIPKKPFSPQPARDAGLAVALGLVIGSVLAIGREQLRIPLEALRRRTTTDSESSAFNRAYFQRSIEEELTRNRTGQVSLGLVQLSGLMDLYENMPPLVKQRLMQYVTKTLQKELRGSDSVGRWTDTSFGVLLPATPAQPATRTLERIQRALTRPVEIDKGERLELAPYVGVAVVAGDQAPTLLINQAESALNEARRSGQSLALYSERAPAKPEALAQAEPEPLALNAPLTQAPLSKTNEPQTPETETLRPESEVAQLQMTQPGLETEVVNPENEVVQLETAQPDLSSTSAPEAEVVSPEHEIVQLETTSPDLKASSTSETVNLEREEVQLESAQPDLNGDSASETEAPEDKSPDGHSPETETVKTKRAKSRP